MEVILVLILFVGLGVLFVLGALLRFLGNHYRILGVAALLALVFLVILPARGRNLYAPPWGERHWKPLVRAPFPEGPATENAPDSKVKTPRSPFPAIAAKPETASAEESEEGESVEKPLHVTERVFHESGLIVSEKPLGEIPDWVTRKAGTGVEEFWVFTSQRFATKEEAIRQLEESLSEQLSEMGLLPVKGFRGINVSLEDLRSDGALLRECLVTWPLELGGFQEEVQQVVVQLRPTHSFRQRLEQALHNRLGRRRLAGLAGGICTMTLLLGVSSLLVRRRARKMNQREPE